MFDLITLKALATLGLEVVLAIGVLGLCMWVVKRIITAQEKERKDWSLIIGNHIQHSTKVLQETCNAMKHHNETNKEAHDDQKEEHKGIAETLTEVAAILRSLNGKK